MIWQYEALAVEAPPRGAPTFLAVDTAQLIPLPPEQPLPFSLVSATATTATISATVPLDGPFSHLTFFAAGARAFADAVAISGSLTGAPGAVLTITETGITRWPRFYWVLAYGADGLTCDLVQALLVTRLIAQESDDGLTLESGDGRIIQET